MGRNNGVVRFSFKWGLGILWRLAALFVFGLVVFVALNKLSSAANIKSGAKKAMIYCDDNGKTKPYCQYKGRIVGLYINQEGLLTAELARPFSLEQFAKIGLDGNTVKLTHIAVSTKIDSPGDVLPTQTMQSWLTKAYQDGYEIQVHLREVKDGYLLIDRMWW